MNKNRSNKRDVGARNHAYGGATISFNGDEESVSPNGTQAPYDDSICDLETSDIALSLLEEKMRGWMKLNEDASRLNADKSGTPRVAKMHRSVQCEVYITDLT